MCQRIRSVKLVDTDCKRSYEDSPGLGKVQCDLGCRIACTMQLCKIQASRIERLGLVEVLHPVLFLALTQSKNG